MSDARRLLLLRIALVVIGLTFMILFRLGLGIRDQGKRSL